MLECPRMNPDLGKLVRLQQAESELRQVQAELAEIPRMRAEREARVAGEQARLEAAREALALCQKSRRQRESDLQALESRRSKYKDQLMEVKTNKEYTAMLHEIEGVEREIRALEDQILAEMERAETLAADAKRAEALFKEAEERHRDELSALDERARKLTEGAARVAAKRDAVAAMIAAEILDLFHRVARLRGVAVAEARDGTCEACHVKLRPQLFVDVKRNDQIVQCDACSRILYYAPSVPAVSPEP